MEKKVGYGFSEVILEADIIATVSVTGVMNDKNYSRALNCHKTFTALIFRSLFKKFIEKT